MSAPPVADLFALLGLDTDGNAVPPPPPTCPDGQYPKWKNGGWVCEMRSISQKDRGGLNSAGIPNLEIGQDSQDERKKNLQKILKKIMKPGPPNGGPLQPRSGGSCSTCNTAKCDCDACSASHEAQNHLNTESKKNMAENEASMTAGATPEDAFLPGAGPATMPSGACVVYRGWGGGTPVAFSTNPCDSGGCSPTTPKGVWAIPASITVPAAGTFVLKVSTPRHANLWAFAVVRVTGANSDDVSLSPWVTAASNVSYPKFGTTATVPDPNSASIPLDAYGVSALLDGQNALPPWVARYDLESTNDVLSTTLSNADAVNAAVLDVFLLVNFG